MDYNAYFERAKKILDILTTVTPQAYIVGGAVRDKLLNKPFNDIDITTSATPEEIKSLFPNIQSKYEDLGCLTLIEDDFRFEISTFKEENYENVSRKPSQIYYSQKFTDDALRRDYTISALAMSKNESIVDVVGGMKDLNKKLIRCIGKPKVRFKEDPLRILRGLYLVSRYNFKLEGKTLRGMVSCKKLLVDVNKDKFITLVFNIMNSAYRIKALNIIKRYNLFYFDESYKRLVELVCKYNKKLDVCDIFSLYYMIKGAVDDNSPFDKNSKNAFRERIASCKYLEFEAIDRIYLFHNSKEYLLKSDFINKIFNNKYKSRKGLIKRVYKCLPIKNINELKITNDDLVKLNNNESGVIIKNVMNDLVDLVLTKKIKNKFKLLKLKAEELLIEHKFDNNAEEIIEEKSNSEVNNVSNHNYEENFFYEESKSYKLNNGSFDEKDESGHEYDELLNEYKRKLNKMIELKIMEYVDTTTTYEEMMKIRESLSIQCKITLLNSNPEFKVLEEKELI